MVRPSKSSPPTPKRRARRSKSRPLVKLALFGLLGIGGAVALYRGGQAAQAPFRLDDQQGVRLAALRHRHERLTLRLADRTRLRDHLRTPEGQEVIARQQGYHKPGEKVYLLRETPPDSR